ncbi:MAG: aminoacyl-tRNA hydrolase [Deltaproteobacteria bacterium]|nr:aminoacyl-tRNA hydrolase [bacterium]MCB9476333.1 aminoacyl-tRNA hydrolase [Deltaproteobacteria bacterium]MCB9478308.1 aminoacyl-tRNA hydrolase [Deltaproteobacteria bacterium]MCB9489292.1 aminoacyl-tRNA hydrolase [Deltaproteobacteria bacterium]
MLIVGLGNPGAKYARTRHNAGFWVVDLLAERWGLPFKGKFKGETASGRYRTQPVILLKPLTFMNVSGTSVQAAMAFYGLEPEQVLVVHDDVDLEPGRLKLKKGGGTGGHNGLRSMQKQLGSPEFYRLRFGVGRPEDGRIDTADYVLGQIGALDWAEYQDAAAVAADAVESFLTEGLEATQNRYHAAGS